MDEVEAVVSCRGKRLLASACSVVDDEGTVTDEGGLTCEDTKLLDSV